MKIWKFIFLGIALIGSLLFCFSMYYPEHTKLILERPDITFEVLKDIKKEADKFTCKSGIEEAITKAGLIPTIQIKCDVVETIKFEGRRAKIINVYYEPLGGDMGGDRSVPVLSLPNKMFVVLPHQYFRGFDLNQYVSESAKAPFAGNWSNFNLDQFADNKLVRKGDNYCIVYKFKFPFTGEVTQCPKPDALNDYRNKANTFYGEVKYLPNVFLWEDALQLALKECPKYDGAKCAYAQWARDSKYSYWGGAHANSAIHVTIKGFKKFIDYYVFAVPLYNKGKESMILVKVFSNSSVLSKKIPRNSYKAEALLELAKTF